jgi:hypothetical protein
MERTGDRMDIYSECESDSDEARSQGAPAKPAKPVAQEPGAGAPAASDVRYEDYLPPMPTPTLMPVPTPVWEPEPEPYHLAPDLSQTQDSRAGKKKLLLGIAAGVVLIGGAVTFLPGGLLSSGSSSSPADSPQAPGTAPSAGSGASAPADLSRTAAGAHRRAGVASHAPKPSASPTAPAVKHAAAPVSPQSAVSPEPQSLSSLPTHHSTSKPKPTPTPTPCLIFWWCSTQPTR